MLRDWLLEWKVLNRGIGVLELPFEGPAVQIAPRHSHVVLPRLFEHPQIAIVHSPTYFCRNTYSHRPGWNLLTAWDNTADANDTMLSDHRSIEDDCSNADQALVPDAACVHYSVMSNSHTVANYSVVLGGAMDHNIVLDTAIRADANPSVIPP
jgi:hypothetical protein